MNKRRKPKPRKGQTRNQRNKEWGEKKKQELEKRKQERKIYEEVNTALEVISFTGFALIEMKTAAGRSRIIGDKETEEIAVTYARDLQAIQYLHYQRILKYPQIAEKINKKVVHEIENLPAEFRQIYIEAQKQIQDKGKEALLIPTEIMQKMEASPIINPKIEQKEEENIISLMPHKQLTPNKPEEETMITDKPIIFRKGK